MKRRTFIKGTTTVFSGLGFSAISSTQTQIKKAEQTFDTYVTMEQEKVSFYSDAINEKIKIIHKVVLLRKIKRMTICMR